MTLEQVVLTRQMLDNGQISEKLHSSIQKDIITLEYIQYSSREEWRNIQSR